MISKKGAWSFLKPLHLIILLTLIQLFIALLSNNLTFTHEEAMWQYIGWNWFHNGLTPYSGGVDNKSPLIFAIFGLSDKLFGTNFWFPRLIGTFCQSVGLYFIYKIAKHIAGKLAGIFALTIYGLSLLWKNTGGSYVSFTETYAMMFIIISFYKCVTGVKKKDFFISGVLAGLGLGFRLSACFGILAIFISATRKSIGSAILFLTGVLAAATAVAIIFSISGIELRNFLIYGFTDNFGTGSATDYNASWRLERFMETFFYSELILFYPFVIGYFFISKKIDFITIWLISEFIGINLLGIYARNHLKDVLPALSLMSGICLASLTETYKVPVKPIMIIIWITFFPKVLDPLFNLKKLIMPASEDVEKYCHQPIQQTDDGEKKLGLWIKSTINEHEKLFVAGYGARVQVYAERQSPTIYFNVTQTRIAKERLFHDLNTANPEMIAVPQFPEYTKYVNEDIRSFINNLITTHYVFNRCMYGYNIYNLKNVN
jgi:hypothetical protein